jgi:uncharacterized protein YndB with AHSA1/START domain
VDAIKGDSMTTPVDLDDDNARLAQNDQLVYVRLAVNHHVGAVWQTLISPEGTAAWLGAGAVLGDKGQSYHCTDGTAGVVRSFHPLEQLRLSWHADAETEPTLIELDVTADGDGTRLRLWHEGLPADQRSAMQARWQQRLEALFSAPAGGSGAG